MKANIEKISPVITAATGYVGVRCPNHPVALRLIKEAQRPIAAPSANKFGHVSPTKAEHVLNDFKNNNVYILDGGSCDIGIESTVVKLVKEEVEDSEDPESIHIKLWILRRGGISEKEFNLAISEFKLKNEKIKLSVE
jgi:L-threonylcarbamoyladenylate synthase